MLCLMLAAACAELRQLEFQQPAGPLTERMNAWIGRDARQLAAHFGPPANTTNLPNRGRVLQYPAEQKLSEPIASYDSQSRTWVVWPRPASCPVDFTISPKGVIESWRAEGADCR